MFQNVVLEVLDEKNEKNTGNRLPTPDKVKKGFRYYCSLVATVALLAVPVRFGPAVCGQFHVGVFQNVVLEVLDGPLPTDKKKRVLVVQHTHFIRHKQFAAR